MRTSFCVKEKTPHRTTPHHGRTGEYWSDDGWCQGEWVLRLVSGCVTESADRGATKIPMTKPQIPIKSQIPMTNVQKRMIHRKNAAVESSLGFGHWDLIGIWGVVIGISAR
jgi:hypothetical protein